MLWSYGVTTVVSRVMDGTLQRTLASLANAGFDRPRLFLDGSAAGGVPANLDVTVRAPSVGPWGNWWLGLVELYLREPACERYAIFQDDVLACKGLREYLSRCQYPDGRDGREPGFWNLYTARHSEWEVGGREGWMQGALVSPGDPSERLQKCIGALGLVFNREAVMLLLSSPIVAQKAAAVDRPNRNIDGCVVTAMNLHRSKEWPAGWREYVHGPSLIQHTGTESTIRQEPQEKRATTFRGEGWDAMEMLKEV